MPFFGLFPRVSGDRQELRRVAGPIIRVIYLSLCQVAVMIAVTILFLKQVDLASAFYERFNWFAGYIPFLRRTGDYFIRANRLDEFEGYLFDLFQLLFLGVCVPPYDCDCSL